MEEETFTVIQLPKLMTILRTVLLSPTLQRHIHQRPKLRNVTRWSRAFEVLQRNIDLQDFVINESNGESNTLLLNAADERCVD